MRIHHGLLGLVLLTSIPAAAVAGDLRGRAVDGKTEEPVEFVTVTLLTEDGETLSTTMTDESGRFRFKGVREGTVGLAFARVAYEAKQLEAIAVEPEGDTEVTVKLEAKGFVMDPVVVSASRTPELTTSAPAAVSVVQNQDIEDSQSLTPVDVIRHVEGVQYTQKGITTSAWRIRAGGGQVVNIGNLVLQDWRTTRLASFAYNFPFNVSAVTADIDRIEVIRAPTGVMYGPEAGTAVIHVLTRSPFEHPGTSLSLAGGNQSLMESWGRHAGLLSPKLGYKFSLRYLKAEDWTPETLPGIGAQNANRDIEHLNGNASLEWRPDQDTRLYLVGGSTSALKALVQAPNFYVQVKDFSSSFGQARLHRRRLMVNLIYNVDHTGSGNAFPFTYIPVKENSRFYSAQVHNGFDIRTGRVLNTLTYGVDLRTTEVRTDSTLSRRWEDNDTVTEIGGFLQTKAAMSPKVDLFGAIRVDYHDRVDDGAVFPFRLGAAYRPSLSQSFRFMVNKQKPVPAPGLLFQDNSIGDVLGYDRSSVYTPKSGWNFQQDCEGGFCMRSRYVEGGVEDFGAADATRTWGAIQDLYPELAGITAPGATEVGTQLATYNDMSRTFVATDASSIQDIAQVVRNNITQIELGYTGWINDRVSLDATAWMQRSRFPFTKSQNITPNVFFDEDSLRDYLIGQNVAPSLADSLARAIAGVPVGTVTPRESGASDGLIYTSVPTGGASFLTTWGIDMGSGYRWPSGWKVRLAYSWVPPRSFVEGQSLPAHPHSVGSVRVAYDPGRPGLRGSVEVRGQTSEYMLVSRWRGEVKGFVVTDLNLGYRFRSLPQMGLYLNISNVFDDRHVEVVGGRVLGRLMTGRIQMDL